VRDDNRLIACAYIATALAVGALVLVSATAVGRAAVSLSHRVPAAIDWMALTVSATVLTASLWDRRAGFTPAGLYALALTAISMGQIERGYGPGDYFLWGALCEWTGLMIVAALVGWSFRRFRLVGTLLHMPDERTYWSEIWFQVVQFVVAMCSAGLIVWISIDARFDTLGTDVALFGLSGRMACCPAALMLLGATILMAWQSGGAWRAAWQYAAMASGVLFTTSVTWARLDVDGASIASLWLDRCINLMISTAMMTLLTRFGLPRVLPHSGDWITRARGAAPVFGALALLLLLAVVVQKAVSP
jgi:hypothetical protein